MTNLLEELKRLEKAATPGPWLFGDNSDHEGSWFGIDSDAKPHSWVVCFEETYGCPTQQDTALIVASRNSLPKLIAALEEAIISLEKCHRTFAAMRVVQERSHGRDYKPEEISTEPGDALSRIREILK